VDDGLGRRDDDDHVGLEQAGVDAERDPAQLPDLDQAGILDVVDHHPAAEAPGERRRDDPELLEVALAEPSRKSSRNEQGLVLDRDAGSPELIDDGADRRSPRVVLRGRDRQRRRLDHDRGAPPRPCEGLERLAGEGKAERVSDGRADVPDCLAGRPRPQDDCVVRRVHDRQPRPREHGDARQGSAR
jgi:hypothetical protein